MTLYHNLSVKCQLSTGVSVVENGDPADHAAPKRAHTAGASAVEAGFPGREDASGLWDLSRADDSAGRHQTEVRGGGGSESPNVEGKVGRGEGTEFGILSMSMHITGGRIKFARGGIKMSKVGQSCLKKSVGSYNDVGRVAMDAQMWRGGV